MNLGSIFRNLPPVTKNLLIINLVMFLVKAVYDSQNGANELGFALGLHYPGAESFAPYQIVTHMFMHGSFYHILFNMIILVWLGGMMEREWGAKKFLSFYLICGLGAAALSAFTAGVEWYMISDQWTVPEQSIIYNDHSIAVAGGKAFGWHVVGASGALYGVMMAFALYYPEREIYVYFLFPIKAKILMPIMMVFELIAGFQNVDDIAHFAHLGGAIIGWLIARKWKQNRYRYR